MVDISAMNTSNMRYVQAHTVVMRVSWCRVFQRLWFSNNRSVINRVDEIRAVGRRQIVITNCQCVVYMLNIVTTNQCLRDI